MNPIRVRRSVRPLTISKSLIRTKRIRPFSSSPLQLELGDQKDAQLDREKMNTESNEGSKTGTDTSTASQNDAAYNPDITNPQSAKEEAGKGNKHNPLDASGANPELGKPTEEESSGAGTKTGSGSRK